MATPPPPPIQTPAFSSPLNLPPQPSNPSHSPSTPAAKSDTPSTPAAKSEVSAEGSVPNLTSRSPDTPTPSVSYTITVPSFSRWFSFNEIHETERKILLEFFDGKSASRNPRVYKYFRDSIIKRFRENPTRKIIFTEARRGLVGDVGSIRRVFDFLEAWGLINYTSSAKPLSKEKKDVTENVEKKESPKKLCSSCKSACSLACFATNKSDIILCARCFVRGNYRPGLGSTDFKRVDIGEEIKANWTDKETLHLLEATLHYGEDWKKVAEHVGSRTEKECVARFISLPFGEQCMGTSEVSEDCTQCQKNDQIGSEYTQESAIESCLSKRRRLTPLADASNPIMAQVAFLSAVVGSEVAGAAARSAIASLDENDLTDIASPNGLKIGSDNEERPGDDSTTTVLRKAAFEAKSQLEKERQDVERSVTDIVEVQMKEIQEKIAHFEEVELRLEKERQQLRYMKDLFFADQLAFLQHKTRIKQGEGRER